MRSNFTSSPLLLDRHHLSSSSSARCSAAPLRTPQSAASLDPAFRSAPLTPRPPQLNRAWIRCRELTFRIPLTTFDDHPTHIHKKRGEDERSSVIKPVERCDGSRRYSPSSHRTICLSLCLSYSPQLMRMAQGISDAYSWHRQN